MDELDEMQEIRGFFIEEAEELFENINTILLESEQNGDLTEDDINRLFRDIHTLKGGSGSVELDYFAKYVHYLEDFIDSIRKGKLVATMAMVDFMMEELDTLIEIIQDEADSSLNVDAFNEKLALLLNKIDTFTKSTTEESSSTILENNFEIENYSEEFVDMNRLLLEMLTNADEDDFESEEYVAEIFRQLHTLKGSSSFMGLVYYPHYLHDLETLLDRARNGEICYTKKFNDAIIKTIRDAEEIAFEEFAEVFNPDNFTKKVENVVALFKAI
jgi:two-component system chemotaxis sensor kinase CheA